MLIYICVFNFSVLFNVNLIFEEPESKLGIHQHEFPLFVPRNDIQSKKKKRIKEIPYIMAGGEWD